MSNSFISTYQNELIACVDNAVIEDLGKQGDHTSKAVFPKDLTSKAQLIAKDDGVLALLGRWYALWIVQFVLQEYWKAITMIK